MDNFSIKNDIVTITKESVETVDLTLIKAEIKYLKAMEEPTDKEVLELAKRGEIHDYYKIDIKLRILELEEELAKWQSS